MDETGNDSAVAETGRKRFQAQPTLADVAAAAGVSTATVSRCLNAPASVRAATRARVEDAVRRLGYEADATARALASRRSLTIGAIVPTLDNAIFAAGIEGLQRALTAEGYTLLIASHEYDLDQELAQARTLLSRGIDGLFLIGKDHHPELRARAAARGAPTVLGWTLSETEPSIGFDNARAAAALADYLWSIGHRRFGMIAAPTAENDRARERLEGVRAALARRGVTLDPACVVERAYGLEEGREGLRALMAREPRPTAIVCGNDVLAFGAMFEAQAMGLSVPDDVSIAGFDDLPLAAQLGPGLTTVGVPASLIGARAAEHLIRRISGQTVATATEVPTRLIVRGSTAPPPT